MAYLKLNRCKYCGGRAEMTCNVRSEDFSGGEMLPPKKYQIFCTYCLINTSIRHEDMLTVAEDWNNNNSETNANGEGKQLC